MPLLCAKCKSATNLKQSHAIPLSFFRKALNRDGGGQFVEISTKNQKNKTTQNSGKHVMLCNTCEAWFNKECDQFIDRVLDNAPRLLPKKPFFLQADTNRLSKFILSVFWRASLSGNELYQSFSIPPKILNSIEDRLFNHPEKIMRTFSFSIHRFEANMQSLDKTWVEDFVMPTVVGKHKHNWPSAWMFAGRGFLFSAYPSKLPSKSKSLVGCYEPNKSALRVPKQDCLDHPFVRRNWRAGLEKERRGFSTVK
ncbi:hypothetical protein [Phaeobacter inhibens]|uniref:hypothetical protein n=1 Tax=Phaeobacter inhibens TaxID=221822 RepID=UPI0021A97183|nr:hypothetical protein [Phaeobacter inhibens]UWR94676.1 hypothetical protein K4K99_09645 [Phaeobacter inhibens]UWS06531.1 hypothetical protein K4K98_09620 [Phaeobacter inhibens]